jgi:hypothetical protein
MTRKLLLALFIAGLIPVSMSSVYANPDDEKRDTKKPGDLIIIIEGDQVKLPQLRAKGDEEKKNDAIVLV